MDEEKILLSRLSDRIKKALKTGRPVWTEFLNPAEQSLCISVLDKRPDVVYSAFGGRERCERRVLCILDSFSDIPPSFDLIKAVKIDFDAFNTQWITHRSILGAVLGLGCDRRMIGDIFINDLSAYVFAIDTAASFVAQHLVSVGRAHVSTALMELPAVDIGEETKTLKRITVAALRMDAVLSGAFHLSRSKTAGLIAAEKVFCNWKRIKKANESVAEGDVISVRGLGRMVLASVGRQSAKGRTWIEIEMY